MTYTKHSFTEEMVRWIRECFEEKRYGTFGFEITMHEGMPVSITKNERIMLKRIAGGIESTY